ncbi:MAG: hypothetical protein HUJ94_05410, partial [Bacteroidales bacterium]|nr:hypothetical protein [Bacteroidales bacterium]
KKIDEWENAKIAEVKEIDAEAMRLYREASETPVKMLRRGRGELKKVYDPFAQVRSFLTGYTVDTAQDIFEQWVELETLLLVKYMDGNVKGQNPDGSFKTSPYSDAIPGEILHPDYTGRWKDAVAADKGEVLMMVEPK